MEGEMRKGNAGFKFSRKSLKPRTNGEIESFTKDYAKSVCDIHPHRKPTFVLITELPSCKRARPAAEFCTR